MFGQPWHTLRNHAIHLLRVSDHFVNSVAGSGLVLRGVCSVVGTNDKELAWFGHNDLVLLALSYKQESQWVSGEW